MSRTYAHAPAFDSIDTRRVRRPRYSDTRAAARREAVAIVREALQR